jgi:hypothetical protein
MDSAAGCDIMFQKTAPSFWHARQGPGRKEGEYEESKTFANFQGCNMPYSRFYRRCHSWDNISPRRGGASYSACGFMSNHRIRPIEFDRSWDNPAEQLTKLMAKAWHLNLKRRAALFYYDGLKYEMVLAAFHFQASARKVL